MLLKDALEEFICDCEYRHLAKGTLRNYRAQNSYLVEHLKNMGIYEVEDVRPTHIRDFLKTKQQGNCKPAYVNDLLKAHKAMFGFLYQEGCARTNAAEKVKNIRQPKTIIATFTESDIKKLLGYYSGQDYLSVRNRTILAMFFDTGIRCNELILMEESDIAADCIVVKHGKGNKERVVPKSPYLGKQLFKYIRVKAGYFKNKPTKYKNLFLSKNGKPLTGEAIARMLKQAAQEVGISSALRVSPHTCRHTFAQLQLKNGLDLYSLSRMMGHTNIAVTQRYLQGVQDSEIMANGKRTSPLMNL